MANNALDYCALEAQSNVTDAAKKAVSCIAQAILTNMLTTTGSHLSRSAKVAVPESFNGNRDKTEQFV